MNMSENQIENENIFQIYKSNNNENPSDSLSNQVINEYIHIFILSKKTKQEKIHIVHNKKDSYIKHPEQTEERIGNIPKEYSDLIKVSTITPNPSTTSMNYIKFYYISLLKLENIDYLLSNPIESYLKYNQNSLILSIDYKKKYNLFKSIPDGYVLLLHYKNQKDLFFLIYNNEHSFFYISSLSYLLYSVEIKLIMEYINNKQVKDNILNTEIESMKKISDLSIKEFDSQANLCLSSIKNLFSDGIYNEKKKYKTKISNTKERLNSLCNYTYQLKEENSKLNNQLEGRSQQIKGLLLEKERNQSQIERLLVEKNELVKINNELNTNLVKRPPVMECDYLFCVICLENIRTILMTKCSHLVYCLSCLNLVIESREKSNIKTLHKEIELKCPICNQINCNFIEVKIC